MRPTCTDAHTKLVNYKRKIILKPILKQLNTVSVLNVIRKRIEELKRTENCLILVRHENIKLQIYENFWCYECLSG